MLKRATAVLLPLALCACAPAGTFDGEMPDFTATRSGATLKFGQTAKVVTVDVGHKVPVQWEVTVEEPSLIDAPRSARQTSQFACFPATFTPVAIGQFPVDVTVALPSLKPIDADKNANVADPAYCGETTLTGYTGDLEVGAEYEAWVASWVGTANPGIEGTGVQLETTDAVVQWR